MSFHCLIYNAPAAGINAVNTDMVAAVEADFTSRNNHYILTEQYQLLLATMVGASVVRGRLQIPTLNAIGEFGIFSANRGLAPVANSQYDNWIPYPVPLPQNEEIQVQTTNNLGAATEIENAVLVVAGMDWNRNLPRGRLPILVRATFNATPVLNAWSGPQAIALSQSLRGGVYAVVGAACAGANAVAFRLIFPRVRMYQGRKLRPGWLMQAATGDPVAVQLDGWTMGLGLWGAFHTFELPQVELFGTVAGATGYSLWLWLVYIDENVGALNQFVG